MRTKEELIKLINIREHNSTYNDLAQELEFPTQAQMWEHLQSIGLEDQVRAAMEPILCTELRELCRKNGIYACINEGPCSHDAMRTAHPGKDYLFITPHHLNVMMDVIKDTCTQMVYIEYGNSTNDGTDLREKLDRLFEEERYDVEFEEDSTALVIR